jgi:fatty-acyl-CoA synthase
VKSAALDYGGYLDRAARLYGDRVAVIDDTFRLTYLELHAAALRLASGLRGLGLRPGDRVADIRWNCVDSVVVDWALAFAGLVKVPTNARFSALEVETLLTKVGTRAVLTSAPHEDLVAAFKGTGGPVELVIADGIDWAVPMSPLLASEPEKRWYGDPDDLLALRFTGGTTGLPKAAMQSHGAQIQTAMSYLMALVDMRADDVVLQTQPYTHGAGQFALPCAMAGAAQLLQAQFDVDAVLDAVDRESATILKIVPTVLFRLLEVQKARPRRLDHLRLINYGAAPMPEQLLREAMDVFDCGFAQTYGQAEAPASIACLTQADHAQERDRPGSLLKSVGRPYPIIDVAIVDESGAGLPTGEVGEVTVRGSIVMTGYWDDPIETAKKLRDGRVHTGDLGYLSAEGYLYLVGRQHDVINSGGYNVYPAEVEQALRAIGGVHDAAVASVPDLEWGEKVVAAVVLQAGATLTEAELIRGCRSQVAGYKTPKQIAIVDALPLTANGKLNRRQVRASFLAPKAIELEN